MLNNLLAGFKPKDVTPDREVVRFPAPSVSDYHLVDFKGLAIRCWNHGAAQGKDPDSTFDTELNRNINSVGWAMQNFYDFVLKPLLASGIPSWCIVFCHDDKHNRYRRTVYYPEYKSKKAKRSKAYEEREKSVLNALKMMTLHLGCMHVSNEYAEADDIIAYLVHAITQPRFMHLTPERAYQKHNIPNVTVHTVDADLLVLSDWCEVQISGKVIDSLVSTPKSIGAYAEALEGLPLDYGEEFKYLTVYKALVGDASDGISGGERFGPRSFVKLVNEIGLEGLDSLVDSLENNKPSEFSEFLPKQDFRQIRSCYLAAQLHPEWCNTPYNKQLLKIEVHHVVPNKNVFEKVLYRFGNLQYEDLTDTKFLENIFPTYKLVAPHNGDQKYNQTLIKNICDCVSPGEVVSFDYESSAPELRSGKFNTKEQKAAGVSLSFGSNFQNNIYVNLNHRDAQRVAPNFVRDLLKALAKKKVALCAQNAAFETQVTRNEANIALYGVQDTMLYQRYVDENSSTGLKFLSKHYLNYEQKSYEQTLWDAKLDNIQTYLSDKFSNACSELRSFIKGKDLKQSQCPIDFLETVSHFYKGMLEDDKGRYVEETKNFKKALKSADITQFSDLNSKLNYQFIDGFLDAHSVDDWMYARDMSQLTSQQTVSYGIDDALVTSHLWSVLYLKLHIERCVEFPTQLSPASVKRLTTTLDRGIALDEVLLEKLMTEEQQKIDEALARLEEILGEHCRVPNREGAINLITADLKFYEASVRHKYKDKIPLSLLQDGIKAGIVSELKDYSEEQLITLLNSGRVNLSALLQKLVELNVHKKTQEAVANSVFLPKSVTVKPPPQVNFTPTGLRNLCCKLGIQPLDKVNKTTVQILLQKVEQVLGWEHPLALILSDMLAGRLPTKSSNPEILLKFSDEVNAYLGVKPTSEISGTLANFNKNVARFIIFSMLGMPIYDNTRPHPQRGSVRDIYKTGGNISADEDTIRTLIAKDCQGEENAWKKEVLDLLLLIAEVTIRFDLYYTKYPLHVHESTQRQHPTFKVAATKTRRPTGGDPNYLQIPKKRLKGRLRGLPKPDEGYVVVCLDFAAQELRIQGSETEDPNLLACYLGKENTSKYFSLQDRQSWQLTSRDVAYVEDLRDIHAQTAMNIRHYFCLDDRDNVIPGSGQYSEWKPSYEDFSNTLKDENSPYHVFAKKLRSGPAKPTNFLLSFGGTAPALVVKLIVPDEVATGIYQSTMSLYSGIGTQQQESLKFAKKYGYVETAYGNRRHVAVYDDEKIAAIFDEYDGAKNRWMRQLYNARIQGCAADILKIVIFELEESNFWNETGAHLIAPVYDEITSMVPVPNVVEYIKRLTEIMNIRPPGHAVPMLADVSLGPNWHEQTELGHFPTEEEITEAVVNSVKKQQELYNYYSDYDLSETP